MVIRESTLPFLELDLSGSVNELHDIATAIVNLRDGETCRFAADLTADPEGYERCLATFEVAATGGCVKLIVIGNELKATGSPEMLMKLASFFSFADDSCEPGTHCHHEWHEGNPYVTEDSRPLVVSVM
jgi:hypothetical protein